MIRSSRYYYYAAVFVDFDENSAKKTWFSPALRAISRTPPKVGVKPTFFATIVGVMHKKARYKLYILTTDTKYDILNTLDDEF